MINLERSLSMRARLSQQGGGMLLLPSAERKDREGGNSINGSGNFVQDGFAFLSNHCGAHRSLCQHLAKILNPNSSHTISAATTEVLSLNTFTLPVCTIQFGTKLTQESLWEIQYYLPPWILGILGLHMMFYASPWLFLSSSHNIGHQKMLDISLSIEQSKWRFRTETLYPQKWSPRTPISLPWIFVFSQHTQCQAVESEGSSIGIYQLHYLRASSHWGNYSTTVSPGFAYAEQPAGCLTGGLQHVLGSLPTFLPLLWRKLRENYSGCANTNHNPLKSVY